MKSEFVMLGKFHFCPDNGYFCRYMDPHGHCIATSCKRMMDLEEQREIDARAKYEQELMDGRIDLYDMAIAELDEMIGMPCVEFEIQED